MSTFKFVSDNDLSTILLKIKDHLTNNYTKKSLKTGSTTEYKVLSDNNLTDALVTKIMNAGDSSFSGNYDDLENKPTIPTKVSDLTNDSGFISAHPTITQGTNTTSQAAPPWFNIYCY